MAGEKKESACGKKQLNFYTAQGLKPRRIRFTTLKFRQFKITNQMQILQITNIRINLLLAVFAANM